MSLKKITKEIYIEQKILKWYRYNDRKLPWRKKWCKKLPNPYYIFVSEFMLQQTTVNAVIPRFKEFINIYYLNDNKSMRDNTFYQPSKSDLKILLDGLWN